MFLRSEKRIIVLLIAVYGLLPAFVFIMFYDTPMLNPNIRAGFQDLSFFEQSAAVATAFLIFVGIAAALIALLPLSSELHLVSYNTTIWGTVYNYNHPIIYQFFEFRYFPLLASVLFIAAAVILQFGRRNRLLLSKIIFAAAVGPFAFSLFRFIVFQGYRTNLIWMDFWEEVTEFIFILGVISVLWFFRRPLFKRQSASDVADPA
jgi:hypothetical protein